GLMPYYSKTSRNQNSSFLSNLTLAFEERRVDDAMQQMRSFFSSIPYDAERQNEAHYKTMFYLIFRLASYFEVRTEERTAAGRSDFVLETDDAVYVFEFKLRGTAEEALRQIDEKGYAIQYEQGTKKLYKIGACFDEELRTLKDWIVKEI
ncbi:MAG: PD-(D/E)XK nuclease domain-containing protein, partial [Cardiobacteriaceae bacterium]|nr:PD-(D/E)XK nuclease domain-containing protein [Cardiobacteriaceae bacterium]